MLITPANFSKVMSKNKTNSKEFNETKEHFIEMVNNEIDKSTVIGCTNAIVYIPESMLLILGQEVIGDILNFAGYAYRINVEYEDAFNEQYAEIEIHWGEYTYEERAYKR